MRCSSCLGTWPGGRPGWTSRPTRVLGARAGPGVPPGGHAGDRGGRGCERLADGRPRTVAGAAAEGAREQPAAGGAHRCRGELDVVAVADVPWPERVLAARAGGLEIVNVHSPISPKPGLAKVLTHEAVFRHLRHRHRPARRARRPQHAAQGAPRRQRLDLRARHARPPRARSAASAGTPPSPR